MPKEIFPLHSGRGVSDPPSKVRTMLGSLFKEMNHCAFHLFIFSGALKAKGSSAMIVAEHLKQKENGSSGKVPPGFLQGTRFVNFSALESGFTSPPAWQVWTSCSQSRRRNVPTAQRALAGAAGLAALARHSTRSPVAPFYSFSGEGAVC